MGRSTGSTARLKVWYAVMVRSSVSIALFFLLSAFFLFALLAALTRSRKSSAIAGVCLVGVVCIIVFLTPVRLPSWIPVNEKEGYQRYDGGSTTTTLPDPRDSSVGLTTSTLTPEMLQ